MLPRVGMSMSAGPANAVPWNLHRSSARPLAPLALPALLAPPALPALLALLALLAPPGEAGGVPAGWDTVGTVTDPRLDEISGAVMSTRQPGTVWVHNDSGDSPRIFALGLDGAVRAEVRVRGAWAIDWEEIARGPGPRSTDQSVSWLYVGDVGDNLHFRRSVQVYRFPEPDVMDGSVDAQRIDLRYPDGKSHNVEAMVVDPRTGELVIFTKRDDRAQVFIGSPDLMDAGGGVLRDAGTIATSSKVTAADISAQGDTIVVREYRRAHVWRRALGESLLDALAREPRTVNAPRSESIAFLPDGKSWISIDEGTGVPVLRGTVPE